MSPAHLRDPGIPRNQLEERKDLGMDTVIKDGKILRKILPTMPLHFKFNKRLQPYYWTDLDQVFKIHSLLKNIFQWSMMRNTYSLATQLAEAGTTTQKICLRDLNWLELIHRMVVWNSKRHHKLL
ncbi:hypothetical protein O181_036616 [Austropuccinia psidii MF-1]|uniref:Uncharacterized protein n=1 Tax=Austropuccinia psidii MF-1 TaxID=1389203 RepID=A0A9Q3HA25_9BASI|nr:hypothetical protein [Austropuccinia psidii MF-1]